jgi:ABC-type glycerol-3-phosphate transport system substrate-binding protein
MAQDNLRMEPFVRLNLIEDLSDLEGEIDPAIFEDLVEGGKFDGTLYFVPYRTNVLLTYYRTDIFDELSLERPSHLRSVSGARRGTALYHPGRRG